MALDRVGLYSSLREPLAASDASTFATVIRRRVSREPTAYITGHKEFYGLDFSVDESVLIPRPETELLAEHAIHLASTVFTPSCLMADVGTGCGAIAVAVAANVPHANIYALDVSEGSLRVAAVNCARHGVDGSVMLCQGDLLAPLPEPVNIVVANLPYVAEAEWASLSPEVSLFEPSVALNGGVDGLRAIERLLLQTPGKVLKGGVLLLEIGCDQGQQVAVIARRLVVGCEVEVIADLSGLDRMVIIQP